jgi:hypothetical protein
VEACRVRELDINHYRITIEPVSPSEGRAINHGEVLRRGGYPTLPRLDRRAHLRWMRQAETHW